MYLKGYTFEEKKCLSKIGIALVLMLSIVTILLKVVGLFIDLDQRLYATIASLLGVLLGGIVYGWSILKLNVFSNEELRYIPIIKKLTKEKK
jgi:PST family polysaccharide transporter